MIWITEKIHFLSAPSAEPSIKNETLDTTICTEVTQFFEGS